MDAHCFEERFGLVTPAATQQAYERNEAVYRCGDAIDGVYCVCSGSVAVFVRTRDELEYPAYVAGAGDLLGIPEVLDEERFACTAVSIEPSTICFISKDEFMNFIRTRPDLSVALMKQICRRIDSMEQAV
jgi:CRP/FNR family transcriptional regulator, polysaccharide utilization system transcription regulator